MGQQPSRPPWLGEVIGALERQLEARRRVDPRANRSRGLARIGAAVRDADAAAGWFRVDRRGQRFSGDQLDSAWLAREQGPRFDGYPVIEAVDEGNEVRVRVAAHAPERGLFLWARRAEPALVLRSLRDRLAEVRRFDLVERFATGSLDPVPAAVGPSPLVRARAACCTPGLHLVWAPPGTGKTEVIARALHELLEKGRSVLLVSGADAALDAVLQRSIAIHRPAPGRMVRVGTPHATEVAEDAGVSLARLVAERCASEEAERKELERRMLALTRDPALLDYEEAARRLEGFDPKAYETARRRLDERERAMDLGRRLERQRADLAEARARASAAARDLERSRQAWEEISWARSELEVAGRLESERAALLQDRDQAAGEALHLETEQRSVAVELAAVATVPLWHVRRVLHRRQLEAWRADVERMRSLARERAAEAERLFTVWSRRIRACLEQAAPVTPEEVAARWSAFVEAARQLESARDGERELGLAVTDVDRQLKEGGAQPTLADEQLRLVARADRQDLPRLRESLSGLREAALPKQAELRRLERQHERVLERLRQAGSRAAAEVIAGAGVVVAPLAALPVERAAAEREYDHVIVDEAAAASPAEVMYAVSRASEGATLLGDFLQSGPDLDFGFDEAPGELDDVTVRHWLAQDCFALFRVRDAESALRTPGCVCLTRQNRFGPGIMLLANEAAYQGALEMDEDDWSGPGEDAEIVFVDLEGLDEGLAGVRRSGGSRWWPAGALVARALAERLADVGGETVGVVAPYQGEAELVERLLVDSGASLAIEVGTPDRFQARELGVVVLDLVEDGEGWLASRQRAERWRRSARRGFMVGVTAARHRLFLVGRLPVVRGARTGPLAAVGRLLDEGVITVVQVRDVLALARPSGLDPAEREVWQAMRSSLRVVGVSGDQELRQVLGAEIDDAVSRVRLWSDFAEPRSRELVPRLCDAMDRGVRVDAVAAGESRAEVLVVDEQRTFIGGLPNGAMLLVESAGFAERVIDDERGNEPLGAKPDAKSRTNAVMEPGPRPSAEG
jgi:hypothetical protein